MVFAGRIGVTWLQRDFKHRKNCECCPVSLLIVGQQRMSWIQVLNCKDCNQCLKCHKSLGLSLSLSLSVYLSLSLSFFCQFMSSHHSDQMSQRSQVSNIDLWRCSLNVFVIVFVCLFVFVIFFLLVSSCPLIILVKCLKGYKFLISLCEGVLLMYLSLSLSLSVYMSLSLSFCWLGHVLSSLW